MEKSTLKMNAAITEALVMYGDDMLDHFITRDDAYPKGVSVANVTLCIRTGHASATQQLCDDGAIPEKDLVHALITAGETSADMLQLVLDHTDCEYVDLMAAHRHLVKYGVAGASDMVYSHMMSYVSCMAEAIENGAYSEVTAEPLISRSVDKTISMMASLRESGVYANDCKMVVIMCGSGSDGRISMNSNLAMVGDDIALLSAGLDHVTRDDSAGRNGPSVNNWDQGPVWELLASTPSAQAPLSSKHVIE